MINNEDIEFINSIENGVSLLDEISKYNIIFGVMTEDEMKEFPINISNMDESITKTKAPLKDIVYFFEKGTLTVPALPFLERSKVWISENLDRVLEDITDGVFRRNWQRKDIRDRLRLFTVEIEYHIRTELELLLGSTLNEKYEIDQSKYLLNPKKIENYIKCRLVSKM